tara:strand:- start:227 stop:556 length:330 start_codon:yes stop_codon:yes gene_type:complete
MRKLLLLPLLFGLVSPAIAHNEFNGGCGNHCVVKSGWKSNPEVNSNSIDKQIKIINEENSQTSSIDNQVDDSEINLNRTVEPKNSMATYILIAILVTVIPFITWRYFTK